MSSSGQSEWREASDVVEGIQKAGIQSIAVVGIKYMVKAGWGWLYVAENERRIRRKKWTTVHRISRKVESKKNRKKYWFDKRCFDIRDNFSKFTLLKTRKVFFYSLILKKRKSDEIVTVIITLWCYLVLVYNQALIKY